MTRLSFPVYAEKDRRKLLDTKESRKPITRKIIKEEEIRMPVERRKIVEEIWASESVRVIEEKTPLVAGTMQTGKMETKEVKHEVAGAEFKTGITGTRTYTGKPSTTRILDTYDVTGAIGHRRQVEELEVVEIRRIYEEIEPFGKPTLDEEEIKRHHSKKFF